MTHHKIPDLKPTNELNNFIDLLKTNAKNDLLSAQLTEMMFSASNALEEEKKKNTALIEVLEKIPCLVEKFQGNEIQNKALIKSILQITRKAIENNKS